MNFYIYLSIYTFECKYYLMNIKNLIVCLCLCCWLYVGFTFAQDEGLRFRTFGIKEGLSQSTVTSVYQDKKGFLWIGTSDGLNQFDGYKFTVYKNNHNDTTSLSDSWIGAILMEDSDNELWILTTDRIINKLNLRSKEITRFSPGKHGAPISGLQRVFFFFEDSKKNIWISTNLGVCTYSKTSKKFVSYINDRNCPAWLSDNPVSHIREDHKGGLWFATSKGLIRYNPTTKKVIQYTQKLHGLLSDRIIWIGEDKKRDGIWVTTSKGLNRFDHKTQQFTSYPFNVSGEIKDGKLSQFSTKIDKRGRIWTGTGFGLFRFDPVTGKYTRYVNGKKGAISNDVITFLYEDKSGDIWIGTLSGLNKYNPAIDGFVSYDWPAWYTEERFVTQILEDKNDNIWVLGKNEPSRGAVLGFVNKKDSKLDVIGSDKCNPDRLASSYVYHPYTDRSGNIWLPTFGDGVIEYIPRNSKFETYTAIQGNSNTPGGNSIWGFGEDKTGNLWIPLFNDGIDKFNPQTKQFTHFSPPRKDKSQYSVFSVTAGAGNDIWFSTVHGGVLHLNAETGVFKQYLNDPARPSSLASNFMRKILADPSGKLWVGHAMNGVDLFDPVTNTAVHFKNNPSDVNSLANNSIWCMLLDSKKELWISSEGYVDRYNPATGKFIHYKSKSPDGINADKALCMHEDTGGNIWFGTSGGGLSLFDRATGKFRHWTETEGLPNNVIYGILEDQQHNLWLSTNKGLSKFDTKRNSFTNYNANNGLQSNEFNMGSCTKTRDGKLYFGGINGFNSFYPENITPDTTRLQTLITGFQIFNKDIPVVPVVKRNLVDQKQPDRIIRDGKSLYLPQDISYSNEVVLTYHEKVFTIEYAALFFDLPDKVSYRYIMEGFDPDWNLAGRRRFATYTNLPAGVYLFKVAAANADGIWNPEATVLKIRILPPFWLTWWFIVFEVLFAFGIFMLIMRLRVMRLQNAKKRLENNVRERTRQIREKNEELELRNLQIMKQKEEIALQAQKLSTELIAQNQMSEMALLRSQINPHFLFNTLNNIYSLVYQRSDEAPEAVMKLSEIMRYMLYEATSDKVLLQNEINYLKSFIELQLLRIKNRDFVSFTISGNLAGKVISPMLLISFVENAFKHGVKKGDNPGITINLEVTDNKINFEVVNFNQKGDVKNKDKTGGIGLTNVKRRLELLYHNRFTLDIKQDDNVFHVKLVLEE